MHASSRLATAIALVLAGAGAMALPAQEAQAPAAEPRAVVAEPVFDAGTVPRGESVEHVFTIANEGGAPLEIREVRPACGCTVAAFDASIPPGGTGRVTALVETANFRGGIAKSVTVFSNDRSNPALQLTIKADVQPFVDVQPGYVRHLHVQGAGPAAARQTLWATDGHRLTLTGVESPLPFLAAEVRRATADERVADGPEEQWVVDTVLASDAPVGPLEGMLVVLTDHPQQPRVEVPLAGFVRPVLQVTPPVVDFGRFPPDQPRKASVLVTNHAKEPLEITGVDSDVPGLETEVQEPEEGRRFQVLLTLSPGQTVGPIAGTMTLRTNNPAMPTVSVELRGQIAAGR